MDTDHIDFHYTTFLHYRASFRVDSHDLTDKGLTFASLKKLIEKNGIRTVDELLAFLSKSKSKTHIELMRSFALLHYSESTQEPAVSAVYPRIILHKDRLFLGLTGDPAKKDFYDGIETIEYVPASASYKFRSMRFAGGKLSVDEDDSRCRKCHGLAYPRPNWSAYDLWPGAFRGARVILPIEERNLGNFLKALQNTDDKNFDRYRYLSFQEDTEYNHDVYSRYQNTHMHVHLSYLNYIRIMKKIRDKAPVDKYKYALLAAFARCEPIEEFLPGKKRDGYKELLEDTRKVLHEEYDGRVQRFNTFNNVHWTAAEHEGKDTDRMNADVVAKLRFLLEPFGIDMRDWSLSYDAGEISYSYNFGVADSGFFTIFMLGRDFILPEVVKNDPVANEIMMGIHDPAWEINKPEWKAPACKWLKKKSLEAFAAKKPQS